MFAGRWDGKLWIGDASAFLATGDPGEADDVLYVYGSRPRGAPLGYVDESLSANVAFTGPGVYSLGPEDVRFIELIGGDVIAAEYSGSGEPAGSLRITRYDGPGGVIEGELTFSATTRSEDASYGPTARLEDGKFRATVNVPELARSP